MKQFVVSILVLLLLCASAAAINSGREAPPFHARTLDGETLDNQSLKGKIVLIQFWTTWCPICRQDQPAVEEIMGKYSKDEVILVAVSVNESKSTVKKFLAKTPRPGKIVVASDTNLPAVFEAKSFPTYVVLSKAGRIAGTQEGAGGATPLRQMLTKAGAAGN